MGQWAYTLLSGLGRKISLDLLGWDFHGRCHLPDTGPVILAANHVSYLDPPLIGSLIHRPIRFMAKHEVFRVPLLGPFLRSIGSFPVRRTERDVFAVRRALHLLEQGEVLGIFPEGTRNRQSNLQQPGNFYDGVGWLAIRSRAPVIPVAIEGYTPIRANSRWTRPTKLRVVCGAPIWFEPEAYPHSNRPYRTEATRQVRWAITSLLTSQAAQQTDTSKVDASKSDPSKAVRTHS